MRKNCTNIPSSPKKMLPLLKQWIQQQNIAKCPAHCPVSRRAFENIWTETSNKKSPGNWFVLRRASTYLKHHIKCTKIKRVMEMFESAKRKKVLRWSYSKRNRKRNLCTVPVFWKQQKLQCEYQLRWCMG